MAYIGGPKGKRCIFCPRGPGGAPRADLVLARTRSAVVLLNRFPYANGHLMVAPRRHVGDLLALDAAAYAGLMDMLRLAARILQDAFRPEGMNIGLNLGRAAGAGIADHLHWHLVPRWVGDTNFMPTIGETAVIPEYLETLYDRLRPRFDALA